MRFCTAIFLLGISLICVAGGHDDSIYVAKTQQTMEIVYPKLYKALEESSFYVIFEANIGKNLARNAEKWGDEYNRNNFEAVRSMVICNPDYANKVLNLDPKMMAMCPVTVTLLYKQGTTTILFERLTPVAAGSAAEDILWEVENTIISAIESVTGN